MTKGNWVILGAALIATVGMAIGLAKLRSTSSVGLAVAIPKVHYEDGQILVSVRNPGEWSDITSFVRPNEPILDNAIREAFGG